MPGALSLLYYKIASGRIIIESNCERKHPQSMQQKGVNKFHHVVAGMLHGIENTHPSREYRLDHMHILY